MEYSEKDVERLKKKYELTNEEFEQGLEQIEKIVFHNKKPVENPVMTLVGGQPGSGKTEMLINNNIEDENGNQIDNDIEDENTVVMSIDDLAEIHPRGDQIKVECPELFSEVTLKAGRLWRNAIYAKVVDEKFNGKTEMIVQDKENDYKLIEKLKERDFKVIVKIMATSLKLSSYFVYKRYEEQLKYNMQYPKLPNAISSYERIPESIGVIEEKGNADDVCIYIQSGNYKSRQVYSSKNKTNTNNKYISAKEALIEERKIQDNQIEEDNKGTIIYGYDEILNSMIKRKALPREIMRYKKDMEDVKKYYISKKEMPNNNVMMEER